MSRRLPREFSMDVEPTHRVPVDAVIALGANLGDRAATLIAAVDEMRRMPLVDRVRVSDVVESVAIKRGGPDAEAPTYFNAVAIVTTRLAPSVLLGYLQAIEDRHGRERRERWDDRTLDLDIIAYGDVRSGSPRLALPHPRAAERDFVLVPWLSLDPDAVLPGAGRVEDLLARLRATA
jgi:2-amino-4-hydroxy-6-hydroxymethyldihydropteridine diphosphokinase